MRKALVCALCSSLLSSSVSASTLLLLLVQTTFTHTAFNDLQRMGLPWAEEQAARQASPGGVGLLAVTSLVPGGPGDKAGLKTGKWGWALGDNFRREQPTNRIRSDSGALVFSSCGSFAWGKLSSLYLSHTQIHFCVCVCPCVSTTTTCSRTQPGDVLVSLHGERCANFTLLEDILDSHVGAPLQMEVTRLKKKKD